MNADKVHYCNACNNELQPNLNSQYALCSKCHSYSLFSESNAEEDNKKYFNEQFKNSATKNSKLRDTIYRIISRIDFSLHRQTELNLDTYFNHGKTSCEIGFGAGSHLIKRLKQGTEIHGIDLSKTAVLSFRNRFPEFKGSVTESIEIPDNCSLVYSDALLEHTQSPKLFLENIHKRMNKSGKIIMRFPFISDHIHDSTELNDINFWAPCHRTVLSMTGIQTLFSSAGYTIEISHITNTYAYRVLNIFLEKGLKNTHQHRNTNACSIDHPNFFAHITILLKAIFKKKRSTEITIIAQKT